MAGADGSDEGRAVRRASVLQHGREGTREYVRHDLLPQQRLAAAVAYPSHTERQTCLREDVKMLAEAVGHGLHERAENVAAAVCEV